MIHFYSATKYAVTALTEGLRQELLEAQTHIRATVRLWSSPGGNGVGPALPPARAQEDLLRASGLNSEKVLSTAPYRDCHLKAKGQTFALRGRGTKGNHTVTGYQHSWLFPRKPHDFG